MNCKNCNSPIESQAHFCPRCGTSAERNTMVGEADHSMQATPPGSRPIEAEATLITPQQSMPPTINPQPFSQHSQHTEQAQWAQASNYLQPEGPIPHAQQQASSYPPQNQQSPLAQPAPLLSYNPNPIAMGSQTPAAAMNIQLQQDTRRSRRGLGC